MNISEIIIIFKVFNMFHTIHKCEATLQVNKYLLGDGRIEHSLKDLR